MPITNIAINLNTDDKTRQTATPVVHRDKNIF
jgi:hypothetical protein